MKYGLYPAMYEFPCTPEQLTQDFRDIKEPSVRAVLQMFVEAARENRCWVSLGRSWMLLHHSRLVVYMDHDKLRPIIRAEVKMNDIVYHLKPWVIGGLHRRALAGKAAQKVSPDMFWVLPVCAEG